MAIILLLFKHSFLLFLDLFNARLKFCCIKFQQINQHFNIVIPFSSHFYEIQDAGAVFHSYQINTLCVQHTHVLS